MSARAIPNRPGVITSFRPLNNRLTLILSGLWRMAPYFSGSLTAGTRESTAPGPGRGIRWATPDALGRS